MTAFSLDKDTAQSLCKAIIAELAAWPALDAALIEGGFEQKAAGRVEYAFERWLKGRYPDLYVLRDVKVPGDETVTTKEGETKTRPSRKRMDLVLIESESVGESELPSIAAVFEIKTNYARQTKEISARLGNDSGHSALVQVRGYQNALSNNGSKGATAYVLYLITSLAGMKLPERSGTEAHSPGLDNGDEALDKALPQGQQCTGFLAGEAGCRHKNDASKPARVYCALIEA